MSFLDIFTTYFNDQPHKSQETDNKSQVEDKAIGNKLEISNNNPQSNIIATPAPSNLYWRLPAMEKTPFTLERLGKNVQRTFNKYKSYFPEFFNKKNTPEEIATQFLKQFFLDGFNESITCYFANLSLKDNSERNITLAVRIPFHPIFNAKLPEDIAVSVTGLCPTDKNEPIFIPQSIAITYGDMAPMDYEKEEEINYKFLDEQKFPPRYNSGNILSSSFTKSLPKFALKTKQRLEEWEAFLDFKERLVKYKTEGVRYVNWQFKEPNTLQFLAIAENMQHLKKIRNAFNCQSLHAFNANISNHPIRFILPQNNNAERLDSDWGNFGQLANNGIKNLADVETNKLIPTLKNLFEEKKGDPLDFSKAVFVSLSIELSEELSYRISLLDDDPEIDNNTDEKTTRSRQDKINDIFKRLPSTGFLSISLVGDLALTSRHRRAVKNLMQNESCYSPYLSSYLFDIQNAKQPEFIPEITEWENPNLNEKQKAAVQKMLAAPDICLIQGPPGTGKTTVIAEACLQFAKRGERVLLASQAHDALDNALSRLQNNPNLRAIRLARNVGRITEEGKEFTGESVLAKQYIALKNYVSRQYLEPQKVLQQQIEQIQNWLKNAVFVEEDLKQLRQHYRDLNAQHQKATNELQERKDAFERLQQAYQRQNQEKQEIAQLIEFLKTGKDNISNIKLSLLPLFDLTRQLCQLQAVKIDQRFAFSIFEAETQNQPAIFQNLYQRWFWVVEAMPKLRSDLERLSLGQDNVDTAILLKIDGLKREIHQLQDNPLLDDDEKLQELWKAKRKELRALQSRESTQNSLLSGDYYHLFSDAERFTQNSNRDEVKSLLHSRLEELALIQQKISQLVDVAISDLQHQQNEPLPIYPTDQEIKSQQIVIDELKHQLEQITEQGKAKNAASKHLLVSGGFDNNANFAQIVDEQRNQLSQLNQKLAEIHRRNRNFMPLFERWNSILQDPVKRSKSDWNELEQPYLESCNVVAISCNENERTLTEQGFDSFDVVIIDEVSKATPLELLLPLMRARKAILVGDHRQLPPIFNEADGIDIFEDKVEENEALNNESGENQADTALTKENLRRFEKMVTASLFKELFEQAPENLKERLEIQFRMHPDIMKMINYFYENRLVCGNPTENREHGFAFTTDDYNQILSQQDHLLWIDTTDDEQGKRYKINQGNNVNELEGRLIARTLVEMDRQAQKNGYRKGNKLKVGVVSFYQPQCRTIRNEIRKLIGYRSPWFEALDVEINTVIRYQGKEKPVILLSLVKNNGGDLNQKFRAGKANIARFEFINVAMSRAQNLLLVFGARNMLENREVKLPRMDERGYEKTMVYKGMFKYLEYQAETGGITTSEIFLKALPEIKMKHEKKFEGN
ncbi:AAA domain-containing protein [Haemophilus paraphrohaemolyticus]